VLCCGCGWYFIIIIIIIIMRICKSKNVSNLVTLEQTLHHKQKVTENDNMKHPVNKYINLHNDKEQLILTVRGLTFLKP
jgi:hypothetical protein